MTSEKKEWHTLRSKGIGGSEITSVLGLNPYQTPYALWEQKTGRVASFEGNKFTVAGNYLEPVVAQMFADQGFELYGGGDQHFSHEVHTFCIGTPDRFVKGKNGDAVLEIKTTQKTPTKDDIPLNWYFQNLWYQGITGKRRGYIAWLSRGVDFDWIEIEFNEDIFSDMIEQAAQFWTVNVLQNIAPPPLKKDDILKIVSKVGGNKELNQDLAIYHSQIKSNSAKIKELEAANDELKEAIQLAMMENETATFMGAKMFSWKEQDKIGVDARLLELEQPEIFKKYKTITTSRVFRIS
jgi:putative phage-type endonuclease